MPAIASQLALLSLPPVSQFSAWIRNPAQSVRLPLSCPRFLPPRSGSCSQNSLPVSDSSSLGAVWPPPTTPQPHRPPGGPGTIQTLRVSAQAPPSFSVALPTRARHIPSPLGLCLLWGRGRWEPVPFLNTEPRSPASPVLYSLPFLCSIFLHSTCHRATKTAPVASWFITSPVRLSKGPVRTGSCVRVCSLLE